MATVAEFGSARRRPAQAPISAHPAFPAIVALWFAALLGFGSLVLPVALFERLVTLTHIDSLVPSAAPPLGFTARAGIALGGSIVGALVGLWLARKVAASHDREPIARSFTVAAERPIRPISARDELGDEGLDSAPASLSPVPLKRRALAISEDNRRSTYLDSVPLPGHVSGDHAAISATVDEPSATDGPLDASDAPAVLEPEPLELAALADADSEAGYEMPEIKTDSGLELLRQRIHTPDDTGIQESPMTDRQSFLPSDFDQDDSERQEFRPLERDRALDGSIAEPADAEPLPFAPPSLRRAAPEVLEGEDDNIEFTSVCAQLTPHFSLVEQSGQSVEDDRPTEELGLVQLAARLGATIEKRRALLAARQGVAPAPLPALASLQDDDFEAAEAEDAARAIADFFGPAQGSEAASANAAAPAYSAPLHESAQPEFAAVPAPLQGLSLEPDEDEDDALAASLSLPLARKSAVTALSPAEDESGGEDVAHDEDEDDEGGNEEEFSSLLAMKNPFVRQQEFVRVETPEDEDDSVEPTVTFPATPVSQDDAGPFARPFDAPKNPPVSAPRPAAPAAARDPGDAERNLREALATLQRMSGAA